MINKLPNISALLLAFALVLSVASAGPAQAKIKQAEAAFQARDFKTALKELKPYLKKKKQPTRASLMLARMYLEGLGVPANYSRAYQHLQRPAKKGNAWAATELGRLYLTGSGVMQSYATAKSWFEKAAKVGYGPAQVELGHIHAKGLSVAKNTTIAYAWYNLAASSLMDKGHTAAVNYRDQIGSLMNDTEIAIAQALSFDWSERIKVVEPEVISLLDKATLLAEQKIEQAGKEISKLTNDVAEKLKTEEKKASAKATEKPKKAINKPQEDAKTPGSITTASKDGKTKITFTPRSKEEIAKLMKKEDVGFVQSISAMITSVIVSIFGSAEPAADTKVPAKPAAGKPASSKQG
jgi:TPR repeat protein